MCCSRRALAIWKRPAPYGRGRAEEIGRRLCCIENRGAMHECLFKAPVARRPSEGGDRSLTSFTAGASSSASHLRLLKSLVDIIRLPDGGQRQRRMETLVRPAGF